MHKIPAFLILCGMALSLTGCPCGVPEQGELTPFSGRFGYYVQGPWGFEGALTKENLTDPAWTLEGTFQFPSSGYRALGPQIWVAESYPEQVTIRFNVLKPSGIDLPVISPHTVKYTIHASNQAVFNVWFVPRCLASSSRS